jgi:RNA polymerase sigma-70 factor (ECF subfamily)
LGESKLHVKTDEFVLSLSRERAVEELMDLYGEEIKRLIYSYIKNWATTDDIVQEVFLKIYLKLHTFKGQASLKTWVYRIAINKCKDYLKSWSYLQLVMTEKITSFEKKGSHSIEEELMQKDTQSELMEKIMSLPVKYREIVILFYIKEFSLLEISELLQINVETVKTRLRRSRGKLYDQYAREEGNVYDGK